MWYLRLSFGTQTDGVYRLVVVDKRERWQCRPVWMELPFSNYCTWWCVVSQILHDFPDSRCPTDQQVAGPPVLAYSQAHTITQPKDVWSRFSNLAGTLLSFFGFLGNFWPKKFILLRAGSEFSLSFAAIQKLSWKLFFSENVFCATSCSDSPRFWWCSPRFSSSLAGSLLNSFWPSITSRVDSTATVSTISHWSAFKCNWWPHCKWRYRIWSSKYDEKFTGYWKIDWKNPCP